MTPTAAEPKQFSLKDDGLIYFQPDASNPLPGAPIARLQKGESYLKPVIAPLPELQLDAVNAAIVTEKLETWFYLYCVKVMEPLMKMLPAEGETLADPVRIICEKVYGALGIVPRADIQDQIAGLDPEMRKILRARRIKLGPVLVFVPDLTKPAAVRLRALLWSLYHDKPLPAPVPKDGAVSAVVEEGAADPAFYQSIGYPLYGSRIIRIDMLDRLMNAIYENVKDNHFKAKHEMAEWLGCSIPDLYTVLGSMGHRKTHDPADAAPAAAAANAETPETITPDDVSAISVDAPPVVGAAVDAPDASLPAADSEEQAPSVVSAAEEVTPAPAPVHTAPVKPELATFRVWWPRKAGDTTGHHRSSAHRPQDGEQGARPGAQKYDPNKPRTFRRKDEEGGADQKGSFKGRKDARQKDRDENRGSNRPRHGDRRPRVQAGDSALRLAASAAAPKPADADSPFAILAGLVSKGE